MHSSDLHLTRGELHDMLDISHAALNVTTDQEMHALLERIRELVPCDRIIAFLGETSAHGALTGVAKLLNVSYPAEWLGAYLENGYASVDPVLLTHFRQFKPQLWSETYHRATSAAERNFIEHASSHGLADGITVGQHSRSGTLGSLFSFAGKAMGEHARHRTVLAHLAPHLPS